MALVVCAGDDRRRLLALHLKYSTRSELVLIAIPKPVKEESSTDRSALTLSCTYSNYVNLYVSVIFAGESNSGLHLSSKQGTSLPPLPPTPAANIHKREGHQEMQEIKEWKIFYHCIEYMGEEDNNCKLKWRISPYVTLADCKWPKNLL